MAWLEFFKFIILFNCLAAGAGGGLTVDAAAVSAAALVSLSVMVVVRSY